MITFKRPELVNFVTMFGFTVLDVKSSRSRFGIHSTIKSAEDSDIAMQLVDMSRILSFCRFRRGIMPCMVNAVVDSVSSRKLGQCFPIYLRKRTNDKNRV